MDPTDELFTQLIVTKTNNGKQDDIVNSCEAIRRFITFEVISGSSQNHSNENKRRFYMIYSKLLDRIFGEDDEARVKNGGWINASMERRKSETTYSKINSTVRKPRKDGLTDDAIALIKLLAAREGEEGSLFSLLWAMEHPVELALDITMLPAPTQMGITNRTANVPLLYTHLLHKPLNHQIVNQRTPALMLTMAEYFLFHFLRYPVSRTRPSSTTTAGFETRKRWSEFRTGGITVLTEGNPYACILLQYLEFFLPNTGVKPKPQSFLASQSGYHHVQIFLHTLVDLWLHQNSIMDTTTNTNSTTTQQQQQTTIPTMMQHTPPLSKASSMPSASLPVHTMGEYIEPTADLLSSLLLFVIYLLNEPVLPIHMPSENAPAATQTVSGVSERLLVLQSRLFQFLQIVLSRCQVQVSSQIFCAALDVWLAYIQPWKVKEAYQSGSSSTSTSQSQYSIEWESYVLSNYHFYTSLLSFILPQLCELKYGSTQDAGRQLRMTLRVLDVYNAELIETLNIASELIGESEKAASVPNPTSATAKTCVWYHLLRNHCLAINVKIEAVWFSVFRRDANKLYERIKYCQHSDKTKELVKDILALLRKNFQVADMGADSGTPSSSSGAVRNRSAVAKPQGPDRDRTKNFTLTETGRRQVQAGLRVCSPEDVSYIGDPMLQPVRSYEFPWLVTLAVAISQWINRRCSLGQDHEQWQHERRRAFLQRTKLGDIDFSTPPPTQFRINLRFMASKLTVGGLFLLWLVSRVVVWLIF